MVNTQMRVYTSITCNGVVFISSPREEEKGIIRRITDDLSAIAVINNFYFEEIIVSSANELFATINQLASKAEMGFRPILHFDMHGDAEKGLEIGLTREMIPWKSLYSGLRALNIASERNLLVVITACQGFYIISPLTPNELTPFWGLIAPEEKIILEDAYSGIVPFYGDLLSSRNLDSALTKLSPLFKYFNSEKIFSQVMLNVYMDNCQGAGARKRKEYLLTQMLQHGIPNTRYNRKCCRRYIKGKIVITQSQLDQYSMTFLGERCTIKLSDIKRIARL